MKVVIVGGGFCGATIAKDLEDVKDISVVLIDKNPFFEYNPSAHKVLTQPAYQNNIRVSFDRFLSNTVIVTEPVKKITPKKIKTESKTIAFDYAVLCLGCSYPIFLSSTENVFTMSRSNEAKVLFKALKKAKKVLIVGGGYIGTEIAGELATKRPDIETMVVHSHDRILQRSPRSASSYAQKFLEKHGVRFLFNEKIVDHPAETAFITKKGKIIDADCCIWCAGTNVDSSFLDGFQPLPVDTSGRIKVTETLQLPEYPHIFAGGDLTSIKEEKTARKAELHARVIASNLKRLHQGKTLKPYKTGSSPMVISLGDNHGIVQFGRLVIPGFIAGVSKWMVEWWTLRQFY